MSTYEFIKVPDGAKISVEEDGSLNVPSNPIIGFIEGDGIGPDIWSTAQNVFDSAVSHCYGDERKIAWMEIFAGEKANNTTGSYLPDETLDAINEFIVAIKGPLTTPIGGGFRSLNVSLRQILDLFACVRPVRHFSGVPSPVLRPELVDMTIFRENTEDVYAGLEVEEGTEEAKKLIDLRFGVITARLNNEMNWNMRDEDAADTKVATAAADTAGEDDDPFEPDQSLALGPILYALPEWALILAMILSFAPMFHHLWFLNYLLWLVAGFAACAWIAQKLKISSFPNWFVVSPFRCLWLIPLTFVPQFFMAMSFGPDTAGGLVPWPPIFLYYALFFGFGALCFACPNYEKRVGKWWPVCLVLTVPAFLAGLHFLSIRTELFHADLVGNWNAVLINNALCALFTVTYTWLAIFGMVGFFRKFFSGENKTIRFVSDSSYWLYLMHLPLVMLLQAIVAPMYIPSIVKFTLICVVTSIVLIVTYRYMVRYTWIGTMLNGKKFKPGERKPTPPPPIIQPANQKA